MKKFDFSKSYEEVEIAGKTYKIDFSDEKTLEYQSLYEEALKEGTKASEIDVEKATLEELKAQQENTKRSMEKFVDVVLGEGEFNELYEKAGKSSIIFVELLEFLGDIIASKTNEVKEKAKSKYVK